MGKGCHILVCGTGSAAHLMATLFSAQGLHSVSILSLSQRGEQFRLAMGHTGVECTSSIGGKETKTIGFPKIIQSQDVPGQIQAADVIFMAMPAFAHESYLHAILPYLKPKTAIVLMPAYGCAELLVQQQIRQLSEEFPIELHLLLLEQLPWVCRTIEFGRSINLIAYKREINCVAMSFDRAANIVVPELDVTISTLELLKSIYQGKLHCNPANNPKSALAFSLFNPNAIMHAALMHGFYQCPSGGGYQRSHFTNQPRFYQEFSPEAVANMDALSHEVLAVKQDFLSKEPSLAPLLVSVRPIQVWMKEAYKGSIQNDATLESCLRTNRVTQTLLHPMQPDSQGGFKPNFQHRYMTEDIPYGLLPLKGFSTLTETATPMLDRILSWSQEILDTPWIQAGCLTEIAKKKPVRTPQRFGIDKFNKLIVVV